MADTVAAIATPAGVGGIAVVRISGGEARRIADKVFVPADKNKSVLTAKGYTAMFGHFYSDGKIADEIIALVFAAPKSYTGEDVVELSCHGGEAVTKNLLRCCIEAGALPAPAGEFTRRAFLNGRISLTQAEAVMDIINAETGASASAAASALEGALYKKINSVQEKLLHLASHISAYIDYPEEGVPDLEQNEVISTLKSAKAEIEKLINGYESGQILQRGIQTAIVGSPNVGKSTLLNLLSGFDRAIVTPIAGTTRDIVEQKVNIGGVQLILSDTAGLRETDDEVEAEGIRRSLGCLEKAGLVLAVFDGTLSLDEGQIKLAKACGDKNAIAVINKADLPQKLAESDLRPYFKTVIRISAASGDYLEDVEKAVTAQLNIKAAVQDGAMLANARQLSAAVRADEALQEAINAETGGYTLDAVDVCIEDALGALYSLTGENVSDTVIDEVFSTFCVGK